VNGLLPKAIHKEKICAIIVSFNGFTVIRATVNALRHSVAAVVVVDNCSTDGTRELLTQMEGIVTLSNDSNMGVAAALNIGVDYAVKSGFDWVLTMDQDSIAAAGMLDCMIDVYKSLPSEERNRVALLAPKFCLADRCIKERFARSCVEKRAVITSGNLLDISAIQEVGGYTDSLFIDSVDFDFCLRLRMAGYKILQCQNALLLHSLGESIQKTIFGRRFSIHAHSLIRKYYISRNHIYVNKKYFAFDQIFCIKKKISFLLFFLQAVLLERNKWQNFRYVCRELKDGFKGKYGKIHC